MGYLPDFEAWAIFAKVAERGSFSQAADDLGLGKTTVSKAITRLETRLGTSLIHRTTRQLALTECGRSSLARARRILDDGACVEAEVLEDAAIPRGPLRVACPPDFAARVLSPALPRFLASYPEIAIEVYATDEDVDLIAAGFDLAIRLGHVPDSSLRISRLFLSSLALVAAPTYLAERGRPGHPDDLAHHRTLADARLAETQTWRFSHPEHGDHIVQPSGPVQFNSGIAAVPALVAGLGIMLQPRMHLGDELSRGLLEEVLTDWQTPSLPVSALTPPGKARPARVRVLVDFLRTADAAA